MKFAAGLGLRKLRSNQHRSEGAVSDKTTWLFLTQFYVGSEGMTKCCVVLLMALSAAELGCAL